jgi:hypothetical protein
MPVIKYNEARIRIGEGSIGDIIIPANSVSVAYAASLEPSRILAANQNNNFRIGGPLAAKITMSFLACNTGSNNAANYIINTLTGNQEGTFIGVANHTFSQCRCTSASVDIAPFAPITVSAEFVSYNMATGTIEPVTPSYEDDLNGYLAHGHNTIISNGTALSDGNYGAISYRVNCGRTPSFTLGQTLAQTIFLDSVEKEMSIKATNIGNFIDYSGYGDTISIDVKDDSGTSIFTPPLSMSANSRIVSQNLSITEGEILAGDISLREVIL